MSIMLISRTPWSRIQTTGELYGSTPVQIHFPNYEQPELEKILISLPQPYPILPEHANRIFMKCVIIGSAMVENELRDMIQFAYRVRKNFIDLYKRYSNSEDSNKFENDIPPHKIPSLISHFQQHIQKQFERKCPTVTITSNTIKNA